MSSGMSMASRLDVIAGALAVFFLLMIVLAVSVSPPVPEPPKRFLMLEILGGQPVHGSLGSITGANNTLEIDGVAYSKRDATPSPAGATGSRVVVRTAERGGRVLETWHVPLPGDGGSRVAIRLRLSDRLQDASPRVVRSLQAWAPTVVAEALFPVESVSGSSVERRRSRIEGIGRDLLENGEATVLFVVGRRSLRPDLAGAPNAVESPAPGVGW